MSERATYPEGVPCWVEVLTPDPDRAAAFYTAVLGWTFSGDPTEYAVARLRGRDVAGVCPLPAGTDPGWVTHIRVDDLDATTRRAVAAGGQVLDGPLDAAPAGRLVVLADPSGAVFCAWEAGVREGAALVNEPGTWSMSALAADDATFYEQVFGWTSDPWEGVDLLRLDGYVGGEPEQPVPRDLVAVRFPPQGPARWHVEFRVHDADAAVEAALAAGGSVVVPAYDGPIFREAVLADPDGSPFSIGSLRAPAPAAATAWYEENAEYYAGLIDDEPPPVRAAALEALVAALPKGGTVLEVGSGNGRDATHLEGVGLPVRRTDATRAFVEMQRAAGHEAEHLDLLRDDLGGPYDGVVAMCVLLHIPALETPPLLRRIAAALRPGGAFLVCTREVDGREDEDTITFWESDAFDAALADAGFADVQTLGHHVDGDDEHWFTKLAVR